MRLDGAMLGRVAILLAVSVASTATAAAGEKKGQTRQNSSETVDSGSFGVFIKGQRVATETFTILEQAQASTIKSQLKETSAADPGGQKSNLEITANGALLRYERSQSSGGSLTVVPKNEFLLEKVSTPSSSKPAEQPFLMPNTSAILDNNFFVHREVLVWRYLAAACKPEGSSFKCQQDPGDFGVLVPQDRSSMHVRLELVGKEKIQVRGTDRDLMRLNLKGEDFD